MGPETPKRYIQPEPYTPNPVEGQLGVVKCLVENRADINVPDEALPILGLGALGV